MNISENSRIWIYQSDRVLNLSEEQEIQNILDSFTTQWLAHGQQLTATAEIRYHRFIILSVDEQLISSTGCSISSSVQILQEIEKLFGIKLFDRFLIAYREGENILSCNREEFEKLIEAGEVNGQTIVFNNMAATRQELETSWEIPMHKSWHARVFELS